TPRGERSDAPPTTAPASRPCAASPCRRRSNPGPAGRARPAGSEAAGTAASPDRRGRDRPKAAGKVPQPRPSQVGVHRAVAQRQGARDLALRQSDLETHTRDVADPTHRQSLGRRRALAVRRGPSRPWRLSANAPASPYRSLLSLPGNGCSRCRGTSAPLAVECATEVGKRSGRELDEAPLEILDGAFV